MDDFHLGDRVIWTANCRLGIIIDLLDYEGGRRGVIGVVLDNPKEFKSISAAECKRHEPPDIDDGDFNDCRQLSWLDDDDTGRLGNDVY